MTTIQPKNPNSLFILVAFAGIAMAQAQDCTTRGCVYLPGVRRAAGNDQTATADAQTAIAASPPLVGATPVGTNGCDTATPAPAEGLQAWIVDTFTANGNYPRVCVRLVVQGRFVYNFTAHIVLHGQTQDWVTDSANGATGVAVTQLATIAGDVVPGSTVLVDAAVPYLDRVYVAHTSYKAP